MAGLLEQEPGGQPGDAGTDDDDVTGSGRAGQAVPEDGEGIDDVRHARTVRDGARLDGRGHTPHDETADRGRWSGRRDSNPAE